MMTQQQIDAIFRRTDAVPENIKASSGYVGARHEWFISVSGEDGFLMPSREIAEITASAKTNTLALIAHIKDQDVLLAAREADLAAALAENERLREALESSRAQWIWSVNAEKCMNALGRQADWESIKQARLAMEAKP